MSRVDKGGRSFKPAVGKALPAKKAAPAPRPSPSPSTASHRPSQAPQPSAASPAPTTPAPTATQSTQQHDNFAVPALPQRHRGASRAPSEARGISIAPEDFGNYDVAPPPPKPFNLTSHPRGRPIVPSMSIEPEEPHAPEPTVPSTAGDAASVSTAEYGRNAAIQSAKSKMAAKAKAAKAGRHGRRSMSILSGRMTPALEATPAPDAAPEAATTQTQEASASGSGEQRSRVILDPALVEPADRAANEAAIEAALAATRPTEPDISVTDAQPLQDSTEEGPSRSKSPQKGAKRGRKPKAQSEKGKGKRKAVAEPEHEEEEDDISPRLRRQKIRAQKRARREQGDSIPVEEIGAEGNPDATPRASGPKKRKVSGKGKGKATATEENENVGEPEDSAPTKKKRRRRPAIKKLRRSPSRPSANAENGDEEDQEDEEDSAASEIDPVATTLMDICADPGIGRTSEVLTKRMELVRERMERETEERRKERRRWLRDEKKIAVGPGRYGDDGEGDGDSEEEGEEKGEGIEGEEGERGEDQEGRGEGDEDEGEDEGEGGEGEEGEGEDGEDAEGEEDGETSIPVRKGKKKKRRQEADEDEDLPEVDAVMSGRALVNGNADEEEEGQEEEGEQKEGEQEGEEPVDGDGQQEEEQDDDERPADDEEEEEDDDAPAINPYAPQMRMVNGRMVLDEASLQVQRAMNNADLEDMEAVVEHDEARLVNSNTWGKRIRGDRWTVDDTLRFYDGIRMFGSDFEMIAQLFPQRTRKQIKLKWNREERLNPQGVTDAMMGKKSVDVLEYGRMVGLDMSGPCPDDPMDKWRKAELEGADEQGENEAMGEGEGQEQEEGRQEEGEEQEEEPEPELGHIGHWGEPGLPVDEDE